MFESDIEEIIKLNRLEYSEHYSSLNLISYEQAKSASQYRESIISSLPDDVTFEFKNTKLCYGNLSPGCILCSEGLWSCLFINNICNASCFYCPDSQKLKSEPTTNGISFSNPKDFIDFIEKFKIKGVGLSGGEPFMTFDRTINFIEKIKNRYADSIYLWIYTNGILASKEKLERLKKAGIDEIRFDITANAYNTDKLEIATRIIGRVTVEIPAIPEDEEELKATVHKLNEMGVNHLNLHQLRLTPYNYKNLIKRPYTFLHGVKVTVLESELLALKILQYASQNKLKLPINYCSFVYKNRFQGAGARKRHAFYLLKPNEEITESGFIKDSQNYFLPLLLSSISYQNSYKEIKLNPKKKVILERKKMSYKDPSELEEIKSGLQEYY
ncbi:MAG: radical SAM protein [Desulfobacterales bacterium]|nr:radical SAM protein [Desulfobacterales bacterium]